MAELHAAAELGVGTPVRLANAYNVALASRDRDYRELLNAGGMNYPDGAPVALTQRVTLALARRHWQARRVRGPSYFRQVLASLEARPNDSSFFLGGSAESLPKLLERLHVRYPRLSVAGSYSPPFADLSASYLDECVRRVADSGANYVWVGLGTPKQDWVAHEIARRLPVVAIGVGAAFDFLAGSTREAPKWIQHSGLEWLHRLLSEPRRLGRRYLVGNFVYLISVVRYLPRAVAAVRMVERTGLSRDT
ncbi:WecB/TagA/CpsF family glycosyltransferase [Microbacterium oleivorans]|uniref:WecB/TagA/CpsF family glycosyltransferase n=1 Tax=Microbacterium oleivorans TaxID=273677 RepID=UPI0011479EBE